jgi:multidrug efflux pump
LLSTPAIYLWSYDRKVRKAARKERKAEKKRRKALGKMQPTAG